MRILITLLLSTICCKPRTAPAEAKSPPVKQTLSVNGITVQELTPQGEFPGDRFVKVAALQWTPPPAKRRPSPEEAQLAKETALPALEQLIAHAARQGAVLVLLPELGVTGYPSDGDFHGSDEARPYAEMIPAVGETDFSGAGWLVKNFSRIARNYRVGVIASLLEVSASPKPFNTLIAFDDQGRLVAQHRKANLSDEGENRESSYITPGLMTATVYRHPTLGRIGLVICADIYSDELIDRHYVVNNSPVADVMMVSSAWSDPSPAERAWVYNVKLAAFLRLPVLAANQFDVAPDAGIINGDGSTQIRVSAPIPAIVYGFLPRRG